MIFKKLIGLVALLSLASAPAHASRVLHADIIENATTGAQLNMPTVAPTINRAAIFNGSGEPASSSTTSTELGYLSGVTSGVQSQLDLKELLSNKDTDVTLSANSDTRYASQKATKAYVDAAVTAGVTFPIHAPTGGVTSGYCFDSDTCMYSTSDGNLSFSTNNVLTLTLEPSFHNATFAGTVTASNFIYPAQTANTFLAAPSTGPPGVPSFRAIVQGDIPVAAIPFPLSAPNGSAGAPSYRFDSDTGMYSLGDGSIAFSTNGVERIRLENNGDIVTTGTIQHTGDVQITGNLSASNFPGAAVWGQITGTLSDQSDLQAALDAKEPTITVLPISKGGTNANGFSPYQVLGTNSAGDTFTQLASYNHDYGTIGLNFTNTLTVPPGGAADNTGYKVNNFELELDPANASTNYNVSHFAVDCHIDRTHSGAAYNGQFNCNAGSLSAEGDGHNNTLNYNTINANLSGNVSGGITDRFYMQNSSLNIGSTYQVGEVHFMNHALTVQSGGLLGSLDMLNHGFNGAVTGNVNYDTSDINSTVGGDANIFRRGLSGNVTGRVQMGQLSHVGNAQSFLGLNILANGLYQDGLQGLTVDTSNATRADGEAAVAISTTGGKIQSSGSIVIKNGQLGQSYHSSDVTLSVLSGAPVANSFMSATSEATSWDFQDDMGDDGTGFNIGAIGRGGFGQFNIAAGKTVDAFNGYFQAWLVPPGSSGTIADTSMIRTEGFISQGGTITATNLKGFHAGQLLCSQATNCWSFYDEAGGENYLSKLAIQTSTKKVVNSAYAVSIGDSTTDPLVNIGDSSLISGDLRAKLRIGYHEIDPSVGLAATRLGQLSVLDVEFTDDNGTALINDYHIARVKIAAGKSMSSPVANHFSSIGRTDSADEGFTPYLVNNVASLTWGNSVTRTAGLYASYLAGFHSVDNQGSITDWYDFYGMADSAGAGVVTNRYGIVIEPAANYTKKNWLSGKTQIGGNTILPPTEALVVSGNTIGSNSSTDLPIVNATFSASSHTTVDGDNTTTGIQSVANATVDATFTNGKSLNGVISTVTRGNGTDDGTLSSAAGFNALMFYNSGSAGVTDKADGFLASQFLLNGNITNLYDFRSEVIPGSAVVTNHYGIYLASNPSVTKQNWISGNVMLGGNSYTTPTHALEVNGDMTISGMINDNTDTNSIDVNARQQIDAAGVVSHDWLNRLLKNTDGDTVADYSDADQLFKLFGGLNLYGTIESSNAIGTAAIQAAAGTGSSCTATGSDLKGQISITTGTIGVSTGVYCSVPFTGTYTASRVCTLTPASPTLSSSVYVSAPSTAGFDVAFAVAGGISSTYVMNYVCP